MGEPGCSSSRCLWVQHQHKTKRAWLPYSQILASCPKRPFWKLPCWEVWPAGSLSASHTQAPEQGLRYPKDGSSKCCSH